MLTNAMFIIMCTFPIISMSIDNIDSMQYCFVVCANTTNFTCYEYEHEYSNYIAIKNKINRDDVKNQCILHSKNNIYITFLSGIEHFTPFIVLCVVMFCITLLGLLLCLCIWFAAKCTNNFET